MTHNATSKDAHPIEPPTKFICCVTKPTSVKRITQILSGLEANVEVLQNENLRAVEKADVVLLGCKPYQLHNILGPHGFRSALRGKLLISILAGVSTRQIDQAIERGFGLKSSDNCKIIRAMPNVAALHRESSTVLCPSDNALFNEPSETQIALTKWIFSRVGTVRIFPESKMDACTALCGSGPAFFAQVLEGAIDGAVAMGLPRADAQLMAAQTMKGTAELVLQGEHPAILRENVSTPGGCTIGGSLVLEEGAVRGTMARAVREATVVASQLGKGQGEIALVNGPKR